MSNITNRLNKVVRTLNSDRIAEVAFQSFRKHTPIDNGYARDHTKKNGRRIEANYPYAQVLEKGRSFRDGQMRGSVQAPQGMTKPTIEDIRKYLFTHLGVKF